MDYLYRRGKTYYYNRRVPVEFLEYVPSRVVCFSLKTDSRKTANRLSALETTRLENFWVALAQGGRKYALERYEQTINRAKAYGFAYITQSELVNGCVLQLADRVNFAAEHKFNKAPVEAALGTVGEPQILISDALLKFWDIRADIIINKTDGEVRKWKNPRRLAVENFITVNGDKPIKDISRDDMLNLRDWWITRIVEDDYSPATANKNFRHVKAVATTIAENYKIKLDSDHIFKKLEFDDDNYEPRKPFDTEYILNTLFTKQSLEGLQQFEIAMIHVLAETGVSISEQMKLLPEDILLNETIPFLDIKPRTKMQLKTKHRRRQMPLVGFALDAFKKFPNGFRSFAKDADSVTSVVNSHFRQKGLFPSEKHSLYSLRHSFQDRLTNSLCIERIQVDLMGHKFDREKYGDGASLDTKRKELSKIQLQKI